MTLFLLLAFIVTCVIFYLKRPKNTVAFGFIVVAISVLLLLNLGKDVAYKVGTKHDIGCFEGFSDGRLGGYYFSINKEKFYFKTAKENVFSDKEIKVSQCYQIRFYNFLGTKYLVDFSLIKED